MIFSSSDSLISAFFFSETDLHAVIRANILEDIHKQYIMYQLFRALKFMHTANVIHRDMKVRARSLLHVAETLTQLIQACTLPMQGTPTNWPEQNPHYLLFASQPSNILLNSDCQMKVCDFGLARSISALENPQSSGPAPVLTDYVATRWYRAPEILLGSTKYTKGVDLWSFGCILGELLAHKPLFPGSSTMNQLERIIEVTGRPTGADIDAIKSPFASTMLESIPPTATKPLHDIFPHASAEALDLLRRLLQFNPMKRISAEAALSHPFVSQFHNPDDEPGCDREISIPIDDNTKYTINDYREKLYIEIVRKKKEIRRRMREPR